MTVRDETMADPVAIQAELVNSSSSSNNQTTHEEGVFVQPSGPSIHTRSDRMTSSSKMNHVEADNSNTHENLDDEVADDDDDFVDFWNVDGASFWDLLASLSMLFLWFQRSTFGILYLFRSLVVGHCLGLLLDWTLPSNNKDNTTCDSSTATATDTHDQSRCSSTTISDWMLQYLTLLQSLLLGENGHKLPLPSPLSSSLGCVSNNNNNNNKSSNSSIATSSQTQQPWPPPALVALAILTIVALVVHPDGMTWILLHKIRDTMVTIFQSSTTCWATLVRDYGVMGTVSASASIALVLVLAIATHKVFLSNCCYSGSSSSGDDSASNRRRHASAAEKKRKKRKGHAHTKGSRGGNRIKGASSPSLLCPRLPKVEEVASDGACDSSSSRSYDSKEISRAASSIEDSSLQSSSQAPIGSIRVDSFQSKDNNNIFIPPRIDSRISASSCFVSQEEEGASIMTSPSALESVVSSEEYERVPSVPSVCTVDTAAMSDDISCGSFSVRSGPTRQSSSRANTANSNNTSKPSNSNNTRGGKTNKLNHGPTHPKATGGRVNHQAARSVTSRIDGPKATTNATKDVSVPSSEGRFGASSNRSKNRGPGGGKAHFGNYHQNARASRGKGGRPHQKSPKNHTPYRTESPQPTTMNQTMISATPSPKTGTMILSTPSSNSMHGDNSNRMPPASPFTQSLFSCEGGASGWSLPALPAVNQTGSPTVAPTFPAMSYQTNSFVAPYSRLPAETNMSNGQVGDGTSGLWYSDNGARSPSLSTNSFATPQRPLRAPPGLAPPPGLESVVTPVKSSAPPHLYTPIRTSATDDTAPSLVPVTPLFGTPTATCSEASPFSWSSYGLDGVGSPVGRRSTVVKENPFAFDTVRADSTDDAECRIEAELQELGGRMVGSVLDF